jgi:multidrug efflux pump subunit AcrB
MTALSKLSLPPGYGIEFDPDAIKAAEAVNGSVYLFVLAVVFCYMVIAACKESFFAPFAVLATVPPSLAFSVLCVKTAGCPINAASAAAFVAVSGLAVNAGVLVVDSIADSVSAAGLYQSLRKRLPALLATSGTTAAGALPFLFTGNGSAAVVRSLALTAVSGVTASVFCALSLIPSLAALFPFLFRGDPRACQLRIAAGNGETSRTHGYESPPVPAKAHSAITHLETAITAMNTASAR